MLISSAAESGEWYGLVELLTASFHHKKICVQNTSKRLYNTLFKSEHMNYVNYKSSSTNVSINTLQQVIDS